MIYRKLSLSILLFAAGFLTASAQKSPQDMDRFIDVLMNKMTLEEKIGQLNLPVTGEITTGQAKSSDIAAKIKKGEVGGLFNLKGVEKIREVQKQAVATFVPTRLENLRQTTGWIDLTFCISYYYGYFYLYSYKVLLMR